LLAIARYGMLRSIMSATGIKRRGDQNQTTRYSWRCRSAQPSYSRIPKYKARERSGNWLGAWHLRLLRLWHRTDLCGANRRKAAGV